jgi:hypothetical protein
LPNKAIERTGKKLALFARRSCPALGSFHHEGKGMEIKCISGFASITKDPAASASLK